MAFENGVYDMHNNQKVEYELTYLLNNTLIDIFVKYQVHCRSFGADKAVVLSAGRRLICRIAPTPLPSKVKMDLQPTKIDLMASLASIIVV